MSSFDSPALQTSSAIAEGTDVTYWSVSGLLEDQTYFWRARASDSVANSPWVQGRFTVNAVNLPPTVPTVNNPGDKAWVATLTPVLEANPVTDPDGDAVSYVFELYQDEELTVLVETFSAESPRWELVDPLVDNSAMNYSVSLRDSADGYVVADAVKFVPVTIEPNTAIWTFTATESNNYDVYAKWTEHENRASNAQYSLTDDTGNSMVTADQREHGGQWQRLGTFAYTEGMQYDVRLTDQADGYVIADAIRFVPTDAPPNTARWNFAVDNSGQYEVYARWTEHPNRATDAVYTVLDNLGETDVTVNQQQDGTLWNRLGVFDFTGGMNYNVSLTDQANGYVIADAILSISDGAAPNSFTWNIQAPATAQYTVYARWSAHPNRATDATYRITHDGGEESITVNQQHDGSQWNELGVFSFTQGLSYPVVLTDEADGYVIADGIRLVPVQQQP